MALDEIAAFTGMWPGGYWEGDPMDPHGISAYAVFDINNGYANQAALRQSGAIKAVELGSMSCLYVTYLMCIRNKVAGRTVLEIGPGRGAWSKVIMDSGAAKLYALDALSASHNGFYDYVDPFLKYGDSIQYIQVQDFECHIPEDVLADFFFSFGCFCHIRRNNTETYFKNIYKKMRPGAEGFVMISDYEKMAHALGTSFDADAIVEGGAETGVPWSHLGTDWFCSMLENSGFEVVDRDIGCNLRDPIVHFHR